MGSRPQPSVKRNTTQDTGPMQGVWASFNAGARGMLYVGEEDNLSFVSAYTNNEELLDNVDSQTAYALDMWTMGHFMSAQMYGDEMTQSNIRLSQSLDNLIDQSEIRAGLTVVRNAGFSFLGKRNMTFEEVLAMEGRTIYAKGNMSTGMAKDGLDIGGAKPVVYKMSIDGGKQSQGAGMWIGKFSNKNGDTINDWGNKQREFITNRDTYWTVGKAYQENGRIVVPVHYEGRLKDHSTYKVKKW